ncbi:MAG TPA: class I SAM-dependent methyltransferase [Candidatus Binatia bacterium]|nr:class I SAM-dependent methyltransferase [Candidatus Binatia bacterium]
MRASAYATKWSGAQNFTDKRSDAGPPSEVPNPLREYFESRVEGRGIWKWLHYFDIYHRHLGKFVGREVHIVEIGIFSGGSLDMWKHYFGPKCRVYGVDIEPACKKYEDEKTKIFIGDQADRGFWKAFREAAPAVDILIDDGGHLPEQQIVTLEEMLPHLRQGGVYICEDVHSLWNGFAAYVAGLADSLNAFVESGEPSTFQRDIHSVHLYPFVTVIEKCSPPRRQFSSVRHGTQWEPFAEKMPGWVPKH